jgi:hypothetical protein
LEDAYKYAVCTSGSTAFKTQPLQRLQSSHSFIAISATMFITKTLALALLGFTAVTFALPVADVAEVAEVTEAAAPQDACERYATRGNFR